MSDELKPCPFCGFDKIIQDVDNTVFCENCGSSFFYTRWNTRPVEDALRAELAAARAEAEKKDAEIVRLRDGIRRGLGELYLIMSETYTDRHPLNVAISILEWTQEEVVRDEQA